MTKSIIRRTVQLYSWAVLLTVAGIVLGSCTTVEGQAVTAGVREVGKSEAAAALEGVDWYRCRASPVGAIVDKYAMNNDTWTAYVISCLGFWRSSPERPPLAVQPIAPPAAWGKPMPFQGPGL